MERFLYSARTIFPKEIQDIREANPGIKVIGHPECPSDVLDACDFAGSTGGMIDYVKKSTKKGYAGY